MKLFKVPAGTTVAVHTMDTKGRLTEFDPEYVTRKDTLFTQEELRVDPLAQDPDQPYSTPGGRYRHHYGFEKDGWFMVVHYEKVEIL